MYTLLHTHTPCILSFHLVWTVQWTLSYFLLMCIHIYIRVYAHAHRFGMQICISLFGVERCIGCVFCVYIFIYMHARIYTHTLLHTHAHTRTHIRIHAHTHKRRAFISLWFERNNVCIYLCVYIYAYVCVYIYAYALKHTHTHTHTYTHTHTHTCIHAMQTFISLRFERNSVCICFCDMNYSSHAHSAMKYV